jgi:hypothetical protein
MAAMQIRQERFSLMGEARPDRSAMPGGKVESQDSGALISVKNRVLPRLKIDVRQGIA